MNVVQVRMLHVAVEELIAAIDYYESQQRGLGERFERAFWDAVELIRINPETSVKMGRDARRRLIRRFPYGVVYSLVAIRRSLWR